MGTKSYVLNKLVILWSERLLSRRRRRSLHRSSGRGPGQGPGHRGEQGAGRGLASLEADPERVRRSEHDRVGRLEVMRGIFRQ